MIVLNKKLARTAKIVLIYSYFSNNEDGFALNQLALSKFMGYSDRTILRHFNQLRDRGFIIVVDKVKLRSTIKAKKGEKIYLSNLYIADQEALNNFIMETTGEDVLANIEENAHIYNDFLTQIYVKYNEAILDETEKLSESEKKAIAKRVASKSKRELKKWRALKSENFKYLDILAELNKENNVKMSYIVENKKRLTNAICATKNPEKHISDKTRMKMLHRFFETEEDIEEFDTNASIYRLSYSLGNKKLANHDTDIYEMIYNKCGFVPEWSKEIRDNFKQLLMPLYMREWSVNFRCFEYNRQSKWSKFYSKRTERAFKFNDYFVKTFKMPLKNILDKICDTMHKIFNLDKFYKADIFIHESNLHILMCKKFKDLGIKTIDVYDGFYFVKGIVTQELFDKVYDEATYELLDDYNKKLTV